MQASSEDSVQVLTAGSLEPGVAVLVQGRPRTLFVLGRRCDDHVEAAYWDCLLRPLVFEGRRYTGTGYPAGRARRGSPSDGVAGPRHAERNGGHRQAHRGRRPHSPSASRAGRARPSSPRSVRTKGSRTSRPSTTCSAASGARPGSPSIHPVVRSARQSSPEATARSARRSSEQESVSFACRSSRISFRSRARPLRPSVVSATRSRSRSRTYLPVSTRRSSPARAAARLQEARASSRPARSSSRRRQRPPGHQVVSYVLLGAFVLAAVLAIVVWRRRRRHGPTLAHPDRKALDPVEEVRPKASRGPGDVDSAEVGEHLLQPDPQLESREVGSEAVVGAS